MLGLAAALGLLKDADRVGDMNGGGNTLALLNLGL